MDFNEYRKHGKEMVDYIADYLENIRDRRVFPNVKPGYMRNLLPESAPVEGEDWSKIFRDVERVIMPGITHWQSPHMHAYFPALNSGPSLLGDMLADAINCLGFTWASSPACTELETITLNWLGKMIGLPDDFLHMGGNGQGGGVIQTTASEATLVCLLAGRTQAIRRFHEKTPGLQDSEINARLVAYCSDQAHSSVEKAALIGLVRMRFIESDEDLSMRGDALDDAICDDIKLGLVPFWVCATLGTTGACAFDNLDEIGSVCQKHKIWLHVDAAYAGSAFICPEYRTVWLKGIEKADSIAFNPSKWLMVHFDCTAMWVKTSAALHRTFNVEPLYLQHENSGLAIDYMHWQIPLSKRFRALKLWFVIRNYGIKGLQKHIREGVRLAQKLEALVLADQRFEIPAVRHLGMVVFRIKGGNDLTERLLKRLNHRGNLHCVPASLKGKYVIRFTITSTHTTNDDILKDWAEVRTVTTELLEELNVKIGDRARVLLKETKEKNEAFGSSLLLANSPMSPKIVNGSFAAIFDTDEFLAKAYAGIRMASQHSPAMRRRVKGILMSGRQFSLDSRMDLVVHGMDAGARQVADADNAEVKNRAITEDGEEGWEACEASGESESTSTDSVQIGTFCHLNGSRPTCAANQVPSPVASTSSEEVSIGDQPNRRAPRAIPKHRSKATLQVVSSLDLPLVRNHKIDTICSGNPKMVSSRQRMSKRNSRIDFQLFENSIACSNPSEKCQLTPQIRYAFYNKGFEMTSINRKFSLVQYEPRTKAIAMPNIDEYAGSPEDNNDSDNNNWTAARSAEAIHFINLNKKNYGGSSGRDITLLPRLKIRISDEMGKRVKSSFDESTSSDENEFSKSFEKRFAASSDEQLCEHSEAVVTDTTFDPFQNAMVIQTTENFRKCHKCGHQSLCKQFTSSFQFE